MSKAKYFSFLRLFIFLGVISLLLFSGTQAKAVVLGDVIINEISWSGSDATDTDKWIELRTTSTSPIDLQGWTIKNVIAGNATLTIDIAFCSTTTIQADGYFLISNATSGFSQIADNIAVQCATDTINLIGSYLLNGPLLLQQGETLIDQTPASTTAAWPAGAAAPGPATSTMARNFSIADGSATSSWHTAIIANGLDATSTAKGEKGTPGSYNGYLVTGTLSQLNADATGTTYIAARIHMVPATTTATATANFSATGTYATHLFQANYDFFAFRDTNGNGAYATTSEPYRSLDNGGAGYSLTSAGISSLNFVMAVNPTISSTTPSTISIGETVTIIGTYFGDSTTTAQGEVYLPNSNIAAGNNISSWSSTSISVVIPSATTPPGPQSGTLYVMVGWTPWASTSTTLTIQPTVTSAVANQNSVAINFDGFMDGGSVSVASNYTLTSNGNPVSLTAAWTEFRGNKVYIKGISLTADNTFSITAGSNIRSIASTTIKTASSTVTGTVLTSPNITSVSPSSGVVGATVTIVGTAFSSATPTVYFSPGPPTGGTPPQPIRAVVSAWSSTRATTTVPTGAKSGPIMLTTAAGAESGMSPNSFFDTLVNLNFKVKIPAGTSLSTSTTRIIIGKMGGPTVYYTGDGSTLSSGIANDATITIPNASSMGFNWAFDNAGNYVSATGREVNPATTTIFNLATSTTKVSGLISGAAANKMLVIFADPVEGSGSGMEFKEPIFVSTNANGTTSYNVGLSATGTYLIGVEDPGFGGTASSSPTLAPANQTVNASTTTPVTGIDFTFTAATARIHGKLEKATGNFATGPGADEFHVFAYQPIENGLHASAMIDSNGEFDLYVNPGVYLIEAGGPRVPSPVKAQIEVKTGDTNFAISNAVIDITLVIKAPTEYIAGQVTDSNGNGVSGVSIFAWSSSGPGGGQAFTDSNGSYKLYLSAGTYTLEGFAPQYGKLTSRSGVTVATNGSSTVDFSVSSEMATISGTLVKNNASSSDMEVWITQGENGWNINRTQTDSNGAYSLKVPYGSGYYLHIGKPGLGEIYKEDLAVFNSGNTSTSSTISINTANIIVRISPASAFSNAFIEVRHSTDFRKRGFSDQDVSGTSTYREYAIEMPKPSSGSYTYIIEGGISNYGPLAPATTSVSSSDSSKTISITLGSSWQVSGQISDPDSVTTGNQAEGAFVWAASPSGHGGGQVDSSGNFSFYLKEGTYDFGVDKQNYAGTMKANQSIIANTAITGLSLTSANLTIAGKVTKSGAAESNAWVWATNGAGGWAGNQTDGSGDYSLKVTSGSWSVRAVSEGYETPAPQLVTISSGTSTLNLAISAMANYTNASPTVESIVPKDGGVIQGNNVRFEAPSGALSSQDSNNGRVSIQKTTSVPQTNGLKPLGGVAYDISAYNASGTSFTVLNSAVTISLTYTAADLTAAGLTQDQASQLSLGYWDSTANTWVSISTNAATSTDGGVTFTGTTNHLSSFAPMESSGSSPPSTPTGFAAAAGNQKITLSWNASVGTTTKYYIYRRNDGLYPYLASTTAATYTYDDGGLTNGTTYYYKLSAANADDDESTSTDAVSATPVTPPLPTGGVSGGYTPTMPQTTTGQVTVTAEAGGKTTITSAENTKATVELPANAVSTETAVTITPVAKTATTISVPIAAVPTGKSVVGGYVYNYTATAGTAAVTTFNQTVTLTITYTDSQISGLNESSLKVYYWNATTSQWVALTTTINAPTNTLTATTNHFTYFAVMGEPAAVAPVTPVAKPISQMTISELQAEIARIMTLIAQLQAELAKLTGTAQSFAVNLYQGLENNAETKRLQEFLISKGYLAAGFNTGNYFSLTVKAVKAYQTTKGITPVSGYFGPLTRAAVNADISATQ